ncbi:hypothetical protein Sme01_68550 [Sphaerisporangium melleum]|uniref:Uncharacterized protein n=1 Tax=Sphaerisporangium melleum TaxID=321316 RepID=A0A917RL39_9ACTN|nr:hypothetical protein GCM10007964_62580 [Sphaerisporangium melleum]GII74379.1 hypothetical protein Sme01_68550 [Sphaerisporangium melleum]
MVRPASRRADHGRPCVPVRHAVPAGPGDTAMAAAAENARRTSVRTPERRRQAGAYLLRTGFSTFPALTSPYALPGSGLPARVTVPGHGRGPRPDPWSTGKRR